MGIVEKAAHHKAKKNKILLKFSFKQKKNLKNYSKECCRVPRSRGLQTCAKSKQ